MKIFKAGLLKTGGVLVVVLAIQSLIACGHKKHRRPTVADCYRDEIPYECVRYLEKQREIESEMFCIELPDK